MSSCLLSVFFCFLLPLDMIVSFVVNWPFHLLLLFNCCVADAGLAVFVVVCLFVFVCLSYRSQEMLREKSLSSCSFRSILTAYVN